MTDSDHDVRTWLLYITEALMYVTAGSSKLERERVCNICGMGGDDLSFLQDIVDILKGETHE